MERAWCASVLLLASCSRTGLEVPEWRRRCVEVAPNERATFTVDATVGRQRSDVVFVMDRSESMGEELRMLRARLRDQVAPALQAALPDIEFGLISFSDFPVGTYGTSMDIPFSLHTTMTADVAQVGRPLDSMAILPGFDEPESALEAIYQTVTGEGLRGQIPPSPPCPDGRFGAVCFRHDSLPILVVFTDDFMHGAPVSMSPYDAALFEQPPHGFDETLEALAAKSARVIGIWSGPALKRGDLRALVEVNAAGAAEPPVLIDIGRAGEHLAEGVVRAVEQLSGDLILDVTARIRDPDPTDEVHVESFVQRVSPLGARPADGIRAISDDGAFIDARSDTTVTFEVELLQPDAKAFTGRTPVAIQIIGDGWLVLVETLIEIAPVGGCA